MTPTPDSDLTRSALFQQGTSELELVQEVRRRRLPARGQALELELDQVAVEQPMEIRVQSHPLAVLMRTPGDDLDLVRGFLISEAIATQDDILHIRHCDISEQADNIVQVTLHSDALFDPQRLRRNLYVSASCGICGKRSIQQALAVAPPLSDKPPFDPQIILRGLEELKSHQPGYRACGGLHAAALLSQDGEILVVREDIGRHNAVDKVIGWTARTILDSGESRAARQGRVLLVSGRVSFEIIQKALAARIGTVAAIGGVSSLAVELAHKARINLLGFASSHHISAYSPHRDDG